MRAALRHLAEKGIEALRPQKGQMKAVSVGNYVAKPAKDVWRRPVVSKRVANVLRKQAIQEGTYGSFDTNSGVGWDPSWDLALHSHRYQVHRFGGMKPNKKTSRARTREERAQKIESNLETRLEKMEEHYVEREEAKVKAEGFEAKFKLIMRGDKK
mmetsp:Transcript_23034/g.35048  ORF Transcript_23034/g.35048 Transcript_23034/m.35048 type:complete len:156 (-) Transcript_23034:86-553(-)